MKENCWEWKSCGRQVGGIKSKELGVCPAALERRLDGIHDGQNAGRACWVVAGTLCKGDVQGSFAAKYHNCKDCDFYRVVQQEEFPDFVLSSKLLERLAR